MSDLRNTAILIPAYNPDSKLTALIVKLKERFDHILIVDDGSKDCENIFSAAEKSATVLKHDVNRGKGAALKTGFRWITERLPECAAVVTADADGQHTPGDIEKVARAALDNPEALTLGVRSFTGKVPFRSRFGNWWTRQFFFFMTHLRVRDTQTGLRGIPASLIPRVLGIAGDRYEYEMAVLADAKNHPRPPVQIPIETVYLKGNASSHFNPLRDSIHIYGALVRFCMSSVGCFLLDNAAFTAFLLIATSCTAFKRATCVLIAMTAARAFSATANYICNRKLVFKSTASKRVSFGRYWMLVLAVMLLGYLATATLSRILDAKGVAITAVKIAAETALFFLSYKLQKNWVFATPKGK